MNTKKVKCICAVPPNADNSQSAAANYLSKIAVEMAKSRRFYRYFIWVAAKKADAGRCTFYTI